MSAPEHPAQASEPSQASSPGAGRSPRPLLLIIGVCVGALLIIGGAIASVLYSATRTAPEAAKEPIGEFSEPRPAREQASDTLVAARLGLVAFPDDFEQSDRYSVAITDYDRADAALGVERPSEAPGRLELRTWLREIEQSPFSAYAPYAQTPRFLEPQSREALAFEASARIENGSELFVHEGDFTPERLDDFADREGENLWNKNRISYLSLQNGALYDAGYDETLLPEGETPFEESIGSDLRSVRVAELADEIDPFSLRVDVAPYQRGGLDYEYDRPNLSGQALAIGADDDRVLVRMVFDHADASEAETNLPAFEQHAADVLPGEASLAQHDSMIAVDFSLDPDEDLAPLLQEFDISWMPPYRI